MKRKPSISCRHVYGLSGVQGLSDGVPLASRETDHKPIFDYQSAGGFLFWYTCDKTSADLRALTFRWRNRVWFRLAWFPDQTAIGFRVKIGQKGDGDIFSELIELLDKVGANRWCQSHHELIVHAQNAYLRTIDTWKTGEEAVLVRLGKRKPCPA